MTLPSSETLDTIYLYAMLQHLEKVLWQARHRVSFFRKEIESLTQQEALPLRYRETYGHIVEALLRVEQAIQEERDKQEQELIHAASVFCAHSAKTLIRRPNLSPQPSTPSYRSMRPRIGSFV